MKKNNWPLYLFLTVCFVVVYYIAAVSHAKMNEESVNETLNSIQYEDTSEIPDDSLPMLSDDISGKGPYR